jgi:hypothetical protein
MSGAPSTWQSVLAAPTPGQHIAQLYTEPGFLVRGVAHFVGDGLRNGEAAILIATPFHWRGIARRLGGDGLDVDELRARGQLTVRDAAETLEGLLVDGQPDAARFTTTVGGLIETVKAAGYPRVRAFGEMVDLLRHRDVTATLRLEELWNQVLATHDVALLCGYSLDAFDAEVHRGLLQRVTSAHSDLIPVEDYGRLERAVESAYADFFGGAGEAADLRRAFLAHYTRPAAMPDAQAAILAAHEFVPASAPPLLARIRHHYRR